MKVTEHIDNAKDPLFSFEIIPPQRGKSAQEIIEIVKDLEPFNPPFIDVTSHSAEAYYEEGRDEILNGVYVKRDRALSVYVGLFKIDLKLIRLRIYCAGDLHAKKRRMQLLSSII